jgi:hypothetical protein
LVATSCAEGLVQAERVNVNKPAPNKMYNCFFIKLILYKVKIIAERGEGDKKRGIKFDPSLYILKQLLIF